MELLAFQQGCAARSSLDTSSLLVRKSLFSHYSVLVARLFCVAILCECPRQCNHMDLSVRPSAFALKLCGVRVYVGSDVKHCFDCVMKGGKHVTCAVLV